MSRIDENKEFIPVRIAVLTVSDTRTADDDRSGDVLAARIEGAEHVLAARKIVRDDRVAIAEGLRGWCADPEIDAVISTGGTGLTGRATVGVFRWSAGCAGNDHWRSSGAG